MMFESPTNAENLFILLFQKKTQPNIICSNVICVNPRYIAFAFHRKEISVVIMFNHFNLSHPLLTCFCLSSSTFPFLFHYV